MLKQASVSDLVSGRVSKDDAYIVITMRRYPRFVNRKFRDEYLTCMSPEPKLFENWLSAKRKYHDHDGAFDRSKFEERFSMNDEGLENLERLSKLSKSKDVILICQCQTGKRCHREFVLLMAKKLFKAKIEKLKNNYPTFEKRIPGFKKQLARMDSHPNSTGSLIANGKSYVQRKAK